MAEMLLTKQTSFWSNLIFSQVIDQNQGNDLREDVDIGSRSSLYEPNLSIFYGELQID